MRRFLRNTILAILALSFLTGCALMNRTDVNKERTEQLKAQAQIEIARIEATREAAELASLEAVAHQETLQNQVQEFETTNRQQLHEAELTTRLSMQYDQERWRAEQAAIAEQAEAERKASRWSLRWDLFWFVMSLAVSWGVLVLAWVIKAVWNAAARTA